jgi:hypothetical protein
MKRTQCHDSLKAIKANYDTALYAVEQFVELAKNRPQLLFSHGIELTDVIDVSRQLHNVYFIYMFACFENSIRSYWRAWRKKKGKPNTEQIIDVLAGRHSISQDTLDDVHDMRNYRNFLVHEDAKKCRVCTIAEASKCLNVYLAAFPIEW